MTRKAYVVGFSLPLITAVILCDFRSLRAGRAAAAPAASVVPAAAARQDENVLRPASLSPYEIARVVNEAADRWDIERQAAEVDLGETWRRLGVEPSWFASCDGCEAETSRHDLDGEPGKEVVLKLTKGFSFCRYLIFSRQADDGKSAGGSWRLLGSVDHDFNKYEMSSHRVIQAGSRNWLVIHGQGGSGTGFSLYSEVWYEVSSGGLRPVLGYLSDGHCAPWPEGLGRDYASEIVVDHLSDGPPSVTIRYRVSYSLLNHKEEQFDHPFTNSHDVRYVWDDGRREFVFDQKNSGVTLDEIAAIASSEDPEVDVWVGEVFLKYNLKTLLESARGGDEKLKAWLRRFLEECPETKESRILSEALREKKPGPAAAPARRN